MLDSVIKKRFFKHHDCILAYMDALEEFAGTIDTTENPSIEFEKHLGLLWDFFHFMEVNESQHEIEEEKLLLPAVEKQIQPPFAPEITISRMIRDHQRGKELLTELRESAEKLRESQEKQPVYFRIYAKRLQELIWHFRRHIEEENSFIIPLADKIFSDPAN